MQESTGLHLGTHAGGKFRLDDTAFVMAFFVPWIREVQLEAIQRRISNTAVQYLNAVVLEDPQVRNLMLRYL